MPPPPNPRDFDLVAILEEPVVDNGLYGYQIGATYHGKWWPLVVCSSQFITVMQAISAAETQLRLTEKAIERRTNRLRARYQAVGPSRL